MTIFLQAIPSSLRASGCGRSQSSSFRRGVWILQSFFRSAGGHQAEVVAKAKASEGKIGEWAGNGDGSIQWARHRSIDGDGLRSAISRSFSAASSGGWP
jgi:hypothetical protein